MSAGVVGGKKDSFMSSQAKIMGKWFLAFTIFSFNLVATFVKKSI